MHKTWLITGVSSGIGLLLAQKALARGDRVVGTSRNSNALGALRDRHGNRLDIVALDLQEPAAVRDAVNRAFERSGRIDASISIPLMRASAFKVRAPAAPVVGL